MEQAFSRPRRKHGRVAVVSMAGLFAILVAILLMPVSLTGAVITGWIVFCIVLGVLWRVQFVNPQKIQNEILAIADVKLTWHEDESGRGWQKDRETIYEGKMDINEYLERKGHNRIIAVMGASRSGKSQLVYKLIQSLSEEKKIIFMFKATDDYTRLGYPTLYIHKAVPNVFVSPEAVARAFLTAFPISTSMQGITASTVRGQVKQIAEKSKNWQDFKKILEDMLKSETENITKGALKFIQNNLPIIYRENVLNYELPDTCVVDFEGSENTEVDMQFFKFYAEFLLNQLSKEVWNKRQNTLFVIDEAHLLTKSGFSIIPEMSALIGAKGSMILASQRIADLRGQALDNCKTQFSFKQSGKENLDEVSAISDLFHQVVAQMLSTYEFTDIGQDRPDQYVIIYRLQNPKPKLYPVKEITINTQDSRGEGSSKTANKEEEKIDYEKDIMEFLSQAGNISEIGKRFADKYGGNGEDYKKDIKDIPKKLIKLEKINVEPVKYVKFGEKQVYTGDTKIYFRKAENPSGLHTYLVNMTADVIFHKGITDFHIMPSGIGTADIESEKVTLEIETGLKNDINDLAGRIKQYLSQGKETIIIVPNQETKKKYLEKYPDVKVLTLPELWREKL
ncbi:ATP-binding protein [Ferroplasma acidiphilum]|uniref:ATP-binding protein n=1 Tax=Ferroplasma acidiphilum TaxID=74969 RepID=A0A7K4FMJ9_9ARCH|nr:ATP-binding protein [Ferroplasma acidiphilum]NOL60243.1 ATP-binding protein [Ferroplasma acidiphilum]